MPKVTFLPDHKTIEVRAGVTLLEASRKARVQIRSRCSGGLSCLMCKVAVEDGGASLSQVQPNEMLKLGDLADQNWRYSCQAKVLGNVTVRLPEDPLKSAIRKQLLQQREEND